MNGWKKAMELRDELSSGLFVRLDERGISGVFCGEPYGRAVVWVGGRPVTYDKRIHRDSAKGMFAFNFYDMKREEMRIIEGSQRLFDAVYAASQNSGLDKCVFEVKKFPPEGQGMPATFTVDAVGNIDAALSSSVHQRAGAAANPRRRPERRRQMATRPRRASLSSTIKPQLNSTRA